jgi:pimeloyl-ACP methyl ester carboxylesterase
MEVRHDGVVIHYVTAGKGNPILFLHGLGGRLENWSLQIAEFRQTRRVIAVDLSGHGRSSGREISFLDYWRWIEALLDHLGLESATLCGFFKGSRAGLMLATRRPARVSRMIVVNAFLHLTNEDAERRRDLYDLLTLGDGGVRWAEAPLDLMGGARSPGHRPRLPSVARGD